MAYTFPTLLVAGTPNDGSASVLVPNLTTSQARIKVKASSNVFFDISNANFSITPGAGNIDYDLALVSVQGLNPGPCESVLEPVVTVFNVGQQMVTAFNVSIAVDGGTPTVISWTGSLASGTGVDVALCDAGPCLALADGDHTVDASVTLTGAADENVSNDAYTTSFATSSGADAVDHCDGHHRGDHVVGDRRRRFNGVVGWSYGATGTTYLEMVCLPYGQGQC